jgi:chaperonin GroEL (HSP60 family)
LFGSLADVYEDLAVPGVIDPTKVNRTAFENAAPMAWLIV